LGVVPPGGRGLRRRPDMGRQVTGDGP
jgi:hypothetical protein